MAGILRLFDLLRVSIRQVFRHRRRYMGVVLAISFGTCGLILVLTVGRDVKLNLNRDLELLGGATRLKVSFSQESGGHNKISRPQWFHGQTIDAVGKLPGVRDVSVLLAKNGPSVTSVRDQEHLFFVQGVDGSFWEANGFSPRYGELFGADAVNRRLRVCVLGAELAKTIFGREDVAGLTLPIDGDLYHITGVLGGLGVGERTNVALLPFTTAQDRLKGLSFPDQMYIRCATWEDVSRVMGDIPRVIQSRQPGDVVRLEVAWEMLNRVKKVAWWMEVFIYLAIVATLVLGGLGIWNGMMATVRSRTHEIGLKKAIGAEDSDILIQFLGEALFLSLGSAVIGIAMGRGAIQIVSRILKSSPSEDLFVLSVGLSLIFSLLLGLGAGFAPSMMASRMEVVSALRYE
jgi:putative ABC transport system permease protein